MAFPVKRFYRSEEEFRGFHDHLKQVPCLHCRLIGSLILHGFLYGYDDRSFNRQKVRGHRIFCSNRRKRGGCGRTFSVLKNTVIKGFTISAGNLWRFLQNIGKGMNKFQAFRVLKLSFSPSTLYRLYGRVLGKQGPIRTLLFSLLPPPEEPKDDPLLQTINHLQSAFKDSLSPPAAFQEHFQVSFL